MTLAESRMNKMMAIHGWFGNEVDVAELWFKVHFLKHTQVSSHEKGYGIAFNGLMEDGDFVLVCLVEAIREANARCHLIISHYFSN